MKRTFTLLALSGLVALLSFGCAMTDHTNTDVQSDNIATNGLSVEAFGCAWANAADAVGETLNSPQRPVAGAGLSSWTDLVGNTPGNDVDGDTVGDPGYVYCTDRAVAAFACQTSNSFAAPTCGNAGPVPAEKVQQWIGRGLASHAFISEATVFGAPGINTGSWAMAGVKGLGSPPCDPNGTSDNGGGSGGGTGGGGGSTSDTVAPEPPQPGRKPVRIVTVHTPQQTTNFTCATDGTDGLEGDVEGSLVGQGLTGGRLPGLYPEAIAIDNSNGINFGRNVRGVHSDPINGGRYEAGFSVFLAVLGRFGEGRHEFVMPSSGLAEFFGGEPMTMHMPTVGSNFTVTVTGELRNDGVIAATIHELGWNESKLTLNNPVDVAFSRDFRKLEFDLNNREGVSEILSWALEAMPLDEPIFLDGVVPELGHVFDPPIGLEISSEFIENMLENEVNVGLGQRRVLGQRPELQRVR